MTIPVFLVEAQSEVDAVLSLEFISPTQQQHDNSLAVKNDSLRGAMPVGRHAFVDYNLMGIILS
jgi:hypothetical protein